MSIIEVGGDDDPLPFVSIPNETARAAELSFKALGLLTCLLSNSAGWRTSVDRLAAGRPDGVASVRSGLNELVEAGYLIRHQERAEAGTFGQQVYRVYRRPRSAPQCGYPPAAYPPAAQPPAGNHPPKEEKDKEDQPQEEKDNRPAPPVPAAVKTKPPTAAQKRTAEAQSLLSSWWSAQAPAPVWNYLAVRNLVGRVLAVHPPEAVNRALDRLLATGRTPCAGTFDDVLRHPDGRDRPGRVNKAAERTAEHLAMIARYEAAEVAGRSPFAALVGIPA